VTTTKNKFGGLKLAAGQRHIDQFFGKGRAFGFSIP
jgi:hypothetical protein